MEDGATSPGNEKPKWQLPRWLWAVFIVSLALNLLVVGSLIGMRIAGHKHGHWGDRGLRGVLRSLPDDQRKDVRAILRKHRENVRPLRRELNRLRRDFISYAEGDVVEAGEVERRLEAIDAQRERVRAQLRPMVVELAGKVDPKVRARLLRRLLGQGRRGRRRHRHRD